MKKAGLLAFVLLLLSGCTNQTEEIERGMTLRRKLLQASSCSFHAEITADYGEFLYTFAMECQGDADGNMTFTVSEPESIAGITGKITEENGFLIFDQQALFFSLLTDDQLSPISAPWILLKTMRSGYLTAAGMDEGRLRLTIDDSYEEDALQVDIWLDAQDMPECAEILYDGRRILSLNVTDFRIL